MEVTKDELERQLGALRSIFDKRHDELREFVGDNRRTANKRHQDNVNRLDLLEGDVRGVKRDVQLINTKLDENTRATNETKASVEGTKESVDTLVTVLQVTRAARTVGDFVRRGLIAAATLAGSIAVLWASVEWLRGRGPPPSIGP